MSLNVHGRYYDDNELRRSRTFHDYDPSGRWKSSYYDDDIVRPDTGRYRSVYEDGEPFSPKTSRRKIAELEERICDLRSSSESMTRKLGRAERALHDLDLNSTNPDMVDRHYRRTKFEDDYDSDDDFGDMTTKYDRHSRLSATDRQQALRREIAQLREDLRVLRRRSASHGSRLDTAHFRDVIDDDYPHHRHHRYHRRYDGDRDRVAEWDRRQRQYWTSSDDNFDVECCRHHRRHHSSLERRRRDFSPTCCGGTGARDIVYRPLTTQHNKSTLLSPTANRRTLYHSFDVSGKRAYKPHSAGDLNIEDVVKFRRAGGRLEVGRVMYVGHLPGKSEAFVGIELENATGNHDGTHDGFRYFECKPNKGLFIPFDHVVMAWGSF